MNSIILCEGTTDAILLSYYLEKLYGWEYSKKLPKPFEPIKKDKNQEINWYKRDDDYLMIFGVGGKDNFKNVIDKYLSKILLNYPSEDSFKNIVIVIDKDESSVSDIEKRCIEWLNRFITDLRQQEWKENKFTDEFGNDQLIKVLPIIIPVDKQGALETTLLDAIKEDEYDSVIVNQCKEFIDNIRPTAEKYIYSDRLALKAYLASVFAVMSPQKVFSQLDIIIKEVAWEKSQILNDCFKRLSDI